MNRLCEMVEPGTGLLSSLLQMHVVWFVLKKMAKLPGPPVTLLRTRTCTFHGHSCLESSGEGGAGGLAPVLDTGTLRHGGTLRPGARLWKLPVAPAEW